MATLDDWLFSRVFEPIAHQTEARWDINNFSLARFSLIPYGAAGLMPVWEGVSAASVSLVFLTIIGVGLGLFNAIMTEAMVSRRGLANITRHAGFWIFFRALWLGFPIGDAVYLIWTRDLTRVPQLVGNLGYLAHLYFLGCSAMPPSLPREIAERAALRSGKLATVEG